MSKTLISQLKRTRSNSIYSPLFPWSKTTPDSAGRVPGGPLSWWRAQGGVFHTFACFMGTEFGAEKKFAFLAHQTKTPPIWCTILSTVSFFHDIKQQKCCRASLNWKCEKPYSERGCCGTVHALFCICGQAPKRNQRTLKRDAPRLHAEGVLAQSPTEPATRRKFTLPLPAQLICPCTFSCQNKTFSRRSRFSRLPREVATQGACLPPAHLAGMPAQHGSGRAGQPRSQISCLPAKTRRAACLPKLGTLQYTGSSRAAGRLWERGSPVFPEP